MHFLNISIKEPLLFYRQIENASFYTSFNSYKGTIVINETNNKKRS